MSQNPSKSSLVFENRNMFTYLGENCSQEVIEIHAARDLKCSKITGKMHTTHAGQLETSLHVTHGFFCVDRSSRSLNVY